VFPATGILALRLPWRRFRPHGSRRQKFCFVVLVPWFLRPWRRLQNGKAQSSRAHGSSSQSPQARFGFVVVLTPWFGGHDSCFMASAVTVSNYRYWLRGSARHGSGYTVIKLTVFTLMVLVSVPAAKVLNSRFRIHGSDLTVPASRSLRPLHGSEFKVLNSRL